jgi:hypothetical protein
MTHVTGAHPVDLLPPYLPERRDNLANSGPIIMALQEDSHDGEGWGGVGWGTSCSGCHVLPAEVVVYCLSGGWFVLPAEVVVCYCCCSC